MKKTFTISFMIMFLIYNVSSQTTVPKVKTGNTGTMTISPDPNDTLSKTTHRTTKQSRGTLQSTNPAITNTNAISVIIDHSGSMTGGPLDAAKNSSIIMIDLIDLWGNELFPQQIGNMNLQYIQFGGKGEFNVIHQLGLLSNQNKLRKDILGSGTTYGNTDFSSGLNEALKQLKGKSFNNKTIFLTDGGDLGTGPNAGKNQYTDLVETKFIIYNNPNASVKQKGWLQAVPNGSEFHVNSEYEVLSHFVKTLFAFVDDIDYYLVRQGNQNIDVGQTFKLFKHSNNKENMLILSKPQNTNIKIHKIIAPSGKELTPDSFLVYDTKTFFNIFLKDSLPSGEYQIGFSNSLNRSHDLYYINFETCNIFLNLSTSPKLGSNGCYLENSSVNFNFLYWDADLNTQIAYPDFLNHSAFHYRIDNAISEKVGHGNQGLTFSHSFPFGSAGTYQVWSAWSYNAEKLKLQNKPPLSLLTEFCITKNGSLVHLDYDTTQTWEGRQIEFTAEILNPSADLISNTSDIMMQTGHGVIILKQIASLQNKYKGKLDYVVSDLHYSLSIDNTNTNYQFAFDKSSITSFLGRKRYINVNYSGKDYTSFRKKNLSTILKKIKYVFSNRHIPHKSYSITGRNITIPYYLPYYDVVNDDIQLSFSVNKTFPDETSTLIFSSDSLEYKYSCDSVSVGGLWGWFSKEYNYPDAVKVNLDINDSVHLNQGMQSHQNCLIHKRKGEMFFRSPLYRMPEFEINSNLQFLIGQNMRTIKLDTTSIKIEISTNPLDRLYLKTKWFVLKFLFLFTLALIALIYLILFLVSKSKCGQKILLWNRIINNELSQPNDLWKEPYSGKQCNPSLELPDEIKNAFREGKGNSSKELFLNWINSDDSHNPIEIRKKICYKSILRSSNLTVKILYIAFFPVSILIDMIRNSVELDTTIISNKRLLDYVRIIEDASIPNLPSEWSFHNQSHIVISFNQPSDNAIRLRHIGYQGRLAEIILHPLEEYTSVVAYRAAIDLFIQDKSYYITQGRQQSTNKNCQSFKFVINEKLEINIEEIDYKKLSCRIQCHSL
jgi:hypothetical protein